MQTASPALPTAPTFVAPPPGFHDLYQRYSETVYRTAEYMQDQCAQLAAQIKALA